MVEEGRYHGHSQPPPLPPLHPRYPHEYDGPPFDWPPYREVREDAAAIEHIRCVYAALLTFCDAQLGRVLDMFDSYNLWDDTMLIVNTDHGFLMVRPLCMCVCVCFGGTWTEHTRT